jgi:hypothetical protein
MKLVELSYKKQVTSERKKNYELETNTKNKNIRLKTEAYINLRRVTTIELSK